VAQAVLGVRPDSYRICVNRIVVKLL